jgi:hypothetical protein
MPNVSDYQVVSSSSEHTYDIYALTSIRLGDGLYATASFFEGGPGVPHRLTLRIMQDATRGNTSRNVIFEQVKSTRHGSF